MVAEDWKEELWLHDWKMMKLERCHRSFFDSKEYLFPNGVWIMFRMGISIRVSIEGAPFVESVLEDWEFEKKPNKKKEKGIDFTLKTKRGDEFIVKGDLLDLLWDLYSLEGEWGVISAGY